MPFRIRVSISAIGSVTAIVGYRRSSALPGTFGSPGGLFRFPYQIFRPGLRLPTGFGHPGNLTLERQLPKAQAAHLELTQNPPRATADAAPVPETDLKLGFLGQLGHHRSARHRLPSHVCPGLFTGRSTLRLLPERQTEMTQQCQAFGVRPRVGHNGDVHALYFLNLGIVDFGKYQLVPHAEGVIAATVNARVDKPRKSRTRGRATL